MTVTELLQDIRAAGEAMETYRVAAERHAQRALRELDAGHRNRAKFLAKLSNRLRRESDYEASH